MTKTASSKTAAAAESAETTGPDVTQTPEPVATAPVLELPSEGGCYIRMPDGSLIRDQSEHGKEA